MNIERTSMRSVSSATKITIKIILIIIIIIIIIINNIYIKFIGT